MGAWGAGPLQNDDAADWVGDLLEADDAELVRSALDDLVERDDDEYIEAPEASVAVAAAELVAAARGRERKGLSKELGAFAARHAKALGGLVALAVRALDRARRSELGELWSHDAAWAKSIDELVTRLG